MLTFWTDGVVSVFMTVLWGLQQVYLSRLKASEPRVSIFRYVYTFACLTVATALLGIIYIFIAIIEGYPTNFFAQATITIFTGYVVALAVEQSPWHKMFINAKKVRALLSRQKYKIGEKRFASPPSSENCVLKIVRNEPTYAKNTNQWFGGAVYTYDGKGLVYMEYGEPDLLGVDPIQLKSLFSGGNTFKDLRILCGIEISWFPTPLLKLSDNVNICTILLLIISSDEGSRAKLRNWKGISCNIPPWVPKAVDAVAHMVTLRKTASIICHMIAPNIENVAKKIDDIKTVYDIDLVISLMMLLHSDNTNIMTKIIDILSQYFKDCFEANKPPVYASWNHIAFSILYINDG